VELYRTIRDFSSSEHYIPCCSVKENGEERLGTATDDVELVPQEAKVVLNDISHLLLRGNSPRPFFSYNQSMVEQHRSPLLDLIRGPNHHFSCPLTLSRISREIRDLASMATKVFSRVMASAIAEASKGKPPFHCSTRGGRGEVQRCFFRGNHGRSWNGWSCDKVTFSLETVSTGGGSVPTTSTAPASRRISARNL
jgi:hypothetical protein